MSGGEIAVVPMGVVVVPIAAVAIGATVAATLAIRAAQAGTEATGRALEQLADEMESSAAAQDDHEIRGRLWEVAAGAVVSTNQELRMLAVRAAKAGVHPALPSPIELTGCKLADVRGLVAGFQAALAKARAAVEQAEAVRERHHLLAQLPAPAGDSPTAAELLARHQTVLAARRHEPDRTPDRAPVTASPPVDGSRAQAEIEQILIRLDPDATSDDREKALKAAARAARQKTVGASRTYIDALTRTVVQEINPRVARRRTAAGLLAALEHPVISEMISDLAPPRPPCLDSIERLRAVVHGDADLTDADQRAARSALAWAQQQLDRRRLLDGVAEAFAGLGYSVSTGLQVHHSASLSVTRQAWKGGHTADVWIDETGRVQSRLIQRTPDAGGEATRCADLNDSLSQVGAELNRRGIDAAVHVPDMLVPALIQISSDAVSPAPPVEESVLAVRSIDPDERER
ncbi:hypothetical protein ACN27F_18355 [Solwaraspora sp. WMMB335]|uniref:hypothetical protein n=1 Tax=Solwaraspora sp. WMMB335 TaxID=3404118 RepID=UPI003B94B4A7